MEDWFSKQPKPLALEMLSTSVVDSVLPECTMVRLLLSFQLPAVPEDSDDQAHDWVQPCPRERHEKSKIEPVGLAIMYEQRS